MISHETEKQEEVVTERPFVCTTCNDSFETLRQLVTHQTRKRGYRNLQGIVTVTNTCVWCQNIYKDRRATYLHHQQSWNRGYCTGKGSHLHTLVIPVKTSCHHCDQHFESVAMLLEHLRAVFPLVRNAEWDPVTVGRNEGSGDTGASHPAQRSSDDQKGDPGPRRPTDDHGKSFIGASSRKHFRRTGSSGSFQWAA